jgi:hypothetical protein
MHNLNKEGFPLTECQGIFCVNKQPAGLDLKNMRASADVNA